MSQDSLPDEKGFYFPHIMDMGMNPDSAKNISLCSMCFETVINKTDNVLYVQNLVDKKYHFHNNRLEELLGFEKNTLNSMNRDVFRELMHPDDYMNYESMINRVVKNKNLGFFDFEFRLKEKNGTWRWFRSKETIYRTDDHHEVTQLFGVAADIHDLKLKEAKIHEGLANLNSLLESTNDIIFTVDRNFRITRMNSRFRKIYSSVFSDQPDDGVSILKLLSEKQLPFFYETFTRVLNGECVRLTSEHDVESEKLYLEATINPVFNDDGYVTSVTIFAKDVTIQRVKRQIIKRQNNLLTSIIESTKSSVFALDTSFRYLAFNSNHQKTMKSIYNVDITLGMKVTEVVNDPVLYAKTMSHLHRALNGESFTIVEEYGLPGHVSTFELHFSPIIDENNVIIGITFLSINISEKIQSKEKLLSAEKKFKDLFENSPDAIFVEDSSGTILDMNPAACQIQGLPKEKLVGTNISRLVPREKFVKVLRDYKSLYLGAAKTIESVVYPYSGGEVPVEISGKLIPYEEKPALLLHIRDISDRKKIERERANAILRESMMKEEMTKTSIRIQEEERNRIAAEMHDEIGAGLSKISILGQVIKKSLHDESTVSDSIEKILQASKEVHENISQIIWAMDPKNDTVENLVSYINYYASEFLESSSIEFTSSIPVDIPSITINGIVRRNTFLIIKESLTNIAKHSCACHVDLKIQFENNMLSFVISDNGKGFDQNNIPRFRNGIGNMRRRIVRLQGYLNIDSKPSEGTTIYLDIPLKIS
jgi:PAS domain S-box-containing protein